MGTGLCYGHPLKAVSLAVISFSRGHVGFSLTPNLHLLVMGRGQHPPRPALAAYLSQLPGARPRSAPSKLGKPGCPLARRE